MGLQEYNVLQRRSIVVRMYTSWLRRGLSSWHRFTRRVRGLERALVSSLRIQKAWRRYWALVEADAFRMCRDEGVTMQRRREALRLGDEAEEADEDLRPTPPWLAEEVWSGSDSDSDDEVILRYSAVGGESSDSNPQRKSENKSWRHARPDDVRRLHRVTDTRLV